jgi:hypothetical protein
MFNRDWNTVKLVEGTFNQLCYETLLEMTKKKNFQVKFKIIYTQLNYNRVMDQTFIHRLIAEKSQFYPRSIHVGFTCIYRTATATCFPASTYASPCQYQPVMLHTNVFITKVTASQKIKMLKRKHKNLFNGKNK